MKKFLRKWLGIERDVELIARRIHCLEESVANAVKLIRQRTDCAIDMHVESSSYAILIGHYKGRDYVEAFPVGNGDMNSLIPILKKMSTTSRTRWIDGHPSFRAVIDRELRD